MSFDIDPQEDIDAEMYAAFAAKDKRIEELLAENTRLAALLNSPETENFLLGVELEAAHQRMKWGGPIDCSKSGENWFWLVGYLAGKALRAAITGDKTKALHHCISSAAALANWHAAIAGDITGCNDGADIDTDPDCEAMKNRSAT